jgi:hypothetical protein
MIWITSQQQNRESLVSLQSLEEVMAAKIGV